MIKECNICGKMFVAKTRKQLTCSKECSTIHHRNYVKRTSQLKKEKRNVERKTEIRNCVICGNEFISKRYNTITCSPECANKRRLMMLDKWKKAHKDKKEPVAIPETLEEICMEARAMGLSYGQYMSQMHNRR